MHGGMDVHGKLLAQGLAARDHRVVLLSTRHPIGKTREIIDGVEIFYLQDTVFGSRRRGWPQESVRAFRTIHRQTPFDLVWSQSFDASGVIPLRRRMDSPPLVLTLHGSVVQEFWSVRENMKSLVKKPPELAKALAGLLYSYAVTQRPLLHCSDAMIAASSVVVHDIVRWFGKGLSSKFTVVNNGVDTGRFKPDEELRQRIRGTYGVGENECLVLSLGRITAAKGYELAVESLRILLRNGARVRLMIAGDGPLLDQLKRSVREKGIEDHVIFTGFVENDRTTGLYNAADVFVMPTLTIEGLPFVLLEAMACEKPVIASRRGGNMTLINDRENGLFVEPGDIGDLVEKIEILMKDRELAARLAATARKFILRDYSLEQMINRSADIMETIAEQCQV